MSKKRKYRQPGDPDWVDYETRYNCILTRNLSPETVLHMIEEGIMDEDMGDLYFLANTDWLSQVRFQHEGQQFLQKQEEHAQELRTFQEAAEAPARNHPNWTQLNSFFRDAKRPKPERFSQHEWESYIATHPDAETDEFLRLIPRLWEPAIWGEMDPSLQRLYYGFINQFYPT